jgi:hypothetical protein
MAQPSVPAFDHIFILIMENHGYDEIIGNLTAEHRPESSSVQVCPGQDSYSKGTHPSGVRVVSSFAFKPVSDSVQSAPSTTSERRI